MKRTSSIKIHRLQIARELRKLKLRRGLSRTKAGKVVAKWLKMRAEAVLPERENPSDKQIRKILRNAQKALDRVTDALHQMPDNARYQIAVELEGLPRFHLRIDEK